VRDADGGLHFVDVLAAFAAGTEGVDAQVFGTNIDFDAVVNFGNYEVGGEGKCGGARLDRRERFETRR